MAGKPGMKGGGGKRPGAGRKPGPKPPEKPKPEPVQVAAGTDMLKMLQDVALGIIDATPIQVRAAIAAVQYTHTKRADGGKKDELVEKANKVAGGKFAPSAPPKLVHSR